MQNYTEYIMYSILLPRNNYEAVHQFMRRLIPAQAR